MTRRMLLVTLATCALAGTSNVGAQTIGFKAGASFSDWNAKVVGIGLGTDAVTSFMGGGYIRFDYGPIGLQPELLVVTRGAGFRAGQFADVKFKVDYVELPILLMARLSRPGGAGPYFFAGPSFAFKIGCKAEASSGGFDVSGNCTDVPDAGLLDPKTMDAGLTAGAGLDLPLGPGMFLVEGRYNLGLTDITDFPGLNIKSRTAAVLAGYEIPLGTPRR